MRLVGRWDETELNKQILGEETKVVLFRLPVEVVGHIFSFIPTRERAMFKGDSSRSIAQHRDLVKAHRRLSQCCPTKIPRPSFPAHLTDRSLRWLLQTIRDELHLCL